MEQIEIKATGKDIDIKGDLKMPKPISTSGFLDCNVKATIIYEDKKPQ